MRLKLSTSFTYSALIGVFFLFFSPFPVIATLQAHGEVYKYERRVSMYDFFFSPFQAQRACQSFIAEIFQELLSSIFIFPYFGKQLRASVSRGRQKIKNDRLSSGCLSCASENVCSSDCILSCPRGWKWVLLLQYLRDQCPAKFSTFSMRANRDLIKVTAAFR